ncbi:hypothetical protein [Streptomyces palmae]|uniref:Uncharacterized protein n=1 Tax=Streptomyces palmae TaxID=1701085 RepID=A0A4Z0GJR3_9ACTN|nr:hypothetical protein [Streptomyces palmae]TGA96267.1 hypothetical protein E4099_24275 [Streptomyces palmae]
MADTKQAETAERPAPDKRTEKRAQRLAHQITTFAASHGGSAEGQLAHIARGSTRIALVGANGEWGNLVAPSYQTAQRAVELAGITLHDDFDGELAAKVRTGRYEWTRMAGMQLGGPDND